MRILGSGLGQVFKPVQVKFLGHTFLQECQGSNL